MLAYVRAVLPNAPIQPTTITMTTLPDTTRWPFDLERYADALADCERALSVHPEYEKCVMRRGTQAFC